MEINIYTDIGVRLFTPIIWQEFFQKYMPYVKVNYVSGQDILKNEPSAILFPGGSGSVFSKAIKDRRNEICSWVESGGKYIGICAGAYLASNTYDWSLGISQITIDRKWKRGKHFVDLKFKDRIKKVEYYNGPLIKEHAGLEIIGTYSSGIPNDNVGADYIGSPAIFTNDYGRGQVLLISPHLERTDLLKEDLCDLLSTFLIYK